MQSGVGNSNYKVSRPGATPPHFVKNVVSTGALLHLLCMLLDSTTKIPDLLVRYLCLAIAAIPVGCAWQVTRDKYIEVDRHGLFHVFSDVFLSLHHKNVHMTLRDNWDQLAADGILTNG